MTISLKSVSGNLLISISRSSFMRLLSCLFIWKLFLCLLIFPVYACFCEVGISALSQGLKRVALYRRGPEEPKGAIALVTRARCSRDMACGLCVPSYCCWVLIAADVLAGRLGSRLATVEEWLRLLQMP